MLSTCSVIHLLSTHLLSQAVFYGTGDTGVRNVNLFLPPWGLHSSRKNYLDSIETGPGIARVQVQTANLHMGANHSISNLEKKEKIVWTCK